MLMPTQMSAIKQIEAWRKSHSISVENQQTIGVQFRTIIFSTIMGPVHAEWPTKDNQTRHSDVYLNISRNNVSDHQSPDFLQKE